MGILGRGRFSRVEELDTDKAVKVIDADAQVAPHSWKTELAALKQLQGLANIVPLLDSSVKLGGFDPEVRIVMPKYAYTLENVLFHFAKANFPPGSGWRNAMPEERIKSIITGISSALEFVHSSQIIHRDIKPENIVFTSYDSEPVLIDFGIAWIPTGSEPADEKVTDVSTGEYKAPELLYGKRNYTEKIDMWALGCVLAQLLSFDCKPPFSPYMSDISLVTSQFKQLGRPHISKCPSLKGSVADTVLSPEPHAPEPQDRLKLRQLSSLTQLCLDLLQFEWTKRPSASEVLKTLAT